jgi:hypothetical protein
VSRETSGSAPGQTPFVSGAFPTIVIVIVGHWVILFLVVAQVCRGLAGKQ